MPPSSWPRSGLPADLRYGSVHRSGMSSCRGCLPYADAAIPDAGLHLPRTNRHEEVLRRPLQPVPQRAGTGSRFGAPVRVLQSITESGSNSCLGSNGLGYLGQAIGAGAIPDCPKCRNWGLRSVPDFGRNRPYKGASAQAIRSPPGSFQCCLKESVK